MSDLLLASANMPWALGQCQFEAGVLIERRLGGAMERAAPRGPPESWGAQAPDWAAPPLPMGRQIRIRRRAAITGTLAIVVIVLALVLRLLSGPP
jgi:hypothetical protein